jgi:small-conductance mechanosensitive channel
VLGVAIGFGSQKLVQDLITGLFLLLENTMQVGDVVALGGLTGTVENLSIRTIRLRAIDGSVHIIPFSSVTTVTNQTRDFSYALIDCQVGLNEEPDNIADVLREVAKTMRSEPRWQDAITADLEVMGVNAFGDNAWTLRVRIRTTPSQRWAVNREFNRRLKYRFDELSIQSPITAWRAQGWLPPGSERPMPVQEPLPPIEPIPENEPTKAMP